MQTPRQLHLLKDGVGLVSYLDQLVVQAGTPETVMADHPAADGLAVAVPALL